MRFNTMAAMAALTLLTLPAAAQEVTYDFDRKTDFGGIKTYAWIKGETLDDPFNHARIVSAVDSQLAAKGMQLVGLDQHPDAYVAYHALFRTEVQVTGISSAWGATRVGANRSGTARTEEVLLGTLVIDLLNPATRAVVWRGIASKEVDLMANPEKREKNITRTVERLLKNYPPKK